MTILIVIMICMIFGRQLVRCFEYVRVATMMIMMMLMLLVAMNNG